MDMKKTPPSSRRGGRKVPYLASWDYSRIPVKQLQPKAVGRRTACAGFPPLGLLPNPLNSPAAPASMDRSQRISVPALLPFCVS